MTKIYHPNQATRLRDVLITALLRSGIPLGTMALLTVRGRRSGQPHTVPVTLLEQNGQSFLVAPYGAVQWVRNLRASGTATLTSRRRTLAISTTEIPAHEAAPVLKQYLTQIAVVRPYFAVAKGAPLDDFEHEAPLHPVFHIIFIQTTRATRGGY